MRHALGACLTGLLLALPATAAAQSGVEAGPPPVIDEASYIAALTHYSADNSGPHVRTLEADIRIDGRATPPTPAPNH